ncbi:hypothetical protein BPMI_04995 [Candidatus Burkholderia pumila]|uniref:DUF3311 domain-containing protein n=1 Tax=Candidatus Burkholderia pumila TaxID=1090375 RepID=A0ABR5HK97_9BURK|nr:hypothetical protein BPMI_04995 [Candidatus Burkholderia pumila]
MTLRWLATLPFIAILLGIPFVNRVESIVLGMPLVLAWLAAWLPISALIMCVIYLCDPANQIEQPDTGNQS